MSYNVVEDLEQPLITKVLFTPHVPVFFGLAGIVLQILSWNFVFSHNFHTAN